jgi:hypothetical protein
MYHSNYGCPSRWKVMSTSNSVISFILQGWHCCRNIQEAQENRQLPERTVLRLWSWSGVRMKSDLPTPDGSIAMYGHGHPRPHITRAPIFVTADSIEWREVMMNTRRRH